MINAEKQLYYREKNSYQDHSHQPIYINNWNKTLRSSTTLHCSSACNLEEKKIWNREPQNCPIHGSATLENIPSRTDLGSTDYLTIS